MCPGKPNYFWRFVEDSKHMMTISILKASNISLKIYCSVKYVVDIVIPAWENYWKRAAFIICKVIIEFHLKVV